LGDQPQDVVEHLSRHRDPGHLEHDVTAVANHLGTDLDQLLPIGVKKGVKLILFNLEVFAS
jgi:hypothetical protein